MSIMSMMRKIAVLMIVFVMLIPSFASCGKKTSPPTENSSETTDTETDTTALYDGQGYLLDNLGTRDYNRPIRIFAWAESAIKEFGVDSTDLRDTLNSAVYSRNLVVENRMGVTLEYQYQDGSDPKMNDFAAKAKILAELGDIDMIAGYSRVASLLMVQGVSADLTSMNNLDFEKPWWPKYLIEKSRLYDDLYFCTGDIAPSLFRESYLIFYNKNLAEANSLPDLYEVVENQEWTIEKMFELGSLVSENNDAVKDENDIFGFTTYRTFTDAFYQGSGLMTIENAPDGSIMISDDFGSSKTHSLLEKLVGYSQSPDHCFSDYGNNLYLDSWYSGKALFTLNTTQLATRNKEKGLKFGILPVPKYDREQEDYLTIPGFFYTIYSIPRSADKDAVSAVLECLASEGYRKTAPALFEVIMKARISEAPEDYYMWDRIKDSLILDSGRVFSEQFEKHTWSVFRDTLANCSTNWVSAFGNYRDSLEAQAASLNTLMLSIKSMY